MIFDPKKRSSILYKDYGPGGISTREYSDDKVIKDLFGVSGSELHEIRTAIAGLQKGELIIKDQMAFALGIGSKYKKINITHLI